jgi:hypothetical protein
MAKTFYQPKLDGKAFAKACARAVAWCEVYLHPERPREVHHEELVAGFGYPHHPMSRFLRERLLIKTSHHYRPSRFCKPGQRPQCQAYIVNLQQVAELQELLGYKPKATDVVLPDAILAEIRSGNFTYAFKGNRYHHPLQRMRREHKPAFWASHGYHHDYDIVASGPSMLYQSALHFGMHPNRLKAIGTYLADRSAFRRHVAALANIDLQAAKHLINALFNNAPLAATSYCGIFVKYLNSNAAALDALKADPQVTELRHNVNRLWQKLAAKTNRSIKHLKSTLYFELETSVLDVITAHVIHHGIRHFTEHDGFRTDHPVNLPDLTQAIKTATGFDLTFDHEQN